MMARPGLRLGERDLLHASLADLRPLISDLSLLLLPLASLTALLTSSYFIT